MFGEVLDVQIAVSSWFLAGDASAEVLHGREGGRLGGGHRSAGCAPAQSVYDEY